MSNDKIEVIKGFTVKQMENKGTLFVYVNEKMVEETWEQVVEKLDKGLPLSFESNVSAMHRLGACFGIPCFPS
jgi:hypothetical protein